MVYILLSLTILSFLYALKQKNENKKILKRIDKLMEEAERGEILESSLDETILSKIESRFKNYLENSYLSKNDLELDRIRVNELISDISHQTKTPIANILLYAELLKEDLGENRIEYIETIHEQGNKLKFLIEDIVKLSRLESGILKVNPRDSNIEDVVNRVVRQFISQAKEKKISFKFNMNTKRYKKVLIDEKWTEEVIANLLDNAIKYSGENSQIEISIKSYEIFTRVDIKDRGIGISQDEFTKIYKRFYRSPKVSQIEGLGLGLHISQKILKEENAYIKVDSRKGGGSIFSLYFLNSK
ncbi:MAG: sensor histidine kinase [Peptoniphilaceae bacterium]